MAQILKKEKVQRKCKPFSVHEITNEIIRFLDADCKRISATAMESHRIEFFNVHSVMKEKRRNKLLLVCSLHQQFDDGRKLIVTASHWNILPLSEIKQACCTHSLQTMCARFHFIYPIFHRQFFSTRYAISRLRDAIQIHSQLWVQVVQLLARFDAVRTVGWIASEQWFFGHHRCIEDVIRNCQLLRFLVIIGCAMDGEQLHGDCMTASQPLLCWIHTF